MSASNDKPYVFISYAHIDSDTVMPIIKEMEKSGINLWYDGGIAAGSEWPEYIADKVINCDRFVLFVSNAYLKSQNCKREINFAISRKKDILSVYIEDVQLSPGMEMQLGTYQAFFRNRFPDGSAFCRSLCGEEFFSSCRSAAASPAAGSADTPINSDMFKDFFASSAKNGGTGYRKETGTAQKVSRDPAPQPPTYNADRAALPVKSRITAGVLAILLGSLGIHYFYLKKPLLGILYILFCWTYVTGIIGVIQGIILLCSSDEKFETKYNCRIK